MLCKCGCGKEFVPSSATLWRIARGDNVGYIRGHWLLGSRNNRWRGGRFVSVDGYIYVLRPDHPNALKKGYVGYVAEHRLVMSDHLGRPLLESELVHHKNEDKADNRLENLELSDRKNHAAYHSKGSKNGGWIEYPPKTCKACGKVFMPQRSNYRRTKYCSKECAHPSGEKAVRAKVSDATICQIVALKGSMPLHAIGKQFGVSTSQVGRYIRGKRSD